jgi:N utilization substance protein A
MKSDFLIAVTQLASERHLPREAVIAAIEAALASAYRKDSVMAGQDISVSLNPANGEIRLGIRKLVVKKVEDELTQVSLTEAKRHKKDVNVDDILDLEQPVNRDHERIAAQTAKQVVLQRLREAEREIAFEEYAEKEGDVVAATVQRSDYRQITLDIGRAEAILPPSERVSSERYRVGQKLKVFVMEVRRGSRGPEIVVSRSHKELLKRLFEIEVPEIHNGVVEIMAIAREPGSRSKVAVVSKQNGIDAVGSCVGLRGIRIQNIVNELQGEKIDVVEWNRDAAIFLANALSPCPVTRVELDSQQIAATVIVPDKQLSLAIGKDGQNARLCARLSGLKVSIKSASEAEEERTQKEDSVEREASLEVTGELASVDSPGDIDDLERASTQEGDQDVGIVIGSIRENAGSGRSMEEELVQATLDMDDREDGEVRQESPPGPMDLAGIGEIQWSSTVNNEAPKVRFAEDIMGSRSNAAGPSENKRKSKSSREDDSRSGRRAKRLLYPEEEEEEEMTDLDSE